MSILHPIEYTPPKGTKYEWNPPVLNHRPIQCYVECLTWPQSLVLSVDKLGKGYQGSLVFDSINMDPTVRRKTRLYKTSLSACRAIEKLGDALLKADTKPWMKTALKMKWRPPARFCENDE